LSTEKRKPTFEMCPLCQDWAGKNVEFKICIKCKFESELMYEQVSINVGTDEKPIFISLKEIMERRLD